MSTEIIKPVLPKLQPESTALGNLSCHVLPLPDFQVTPVYETCKHHQYQTGQHRMIALIGVGKDLNNKYSLDHHATQKPDAKQRSEQKREP